MSCLPENQCLQDEFTISKGSIEVEFSLVDSDVFANDRPGRRNLGENDLSVGNHVNLLLVMKREERGKEKGVRNFKLYIVLYFGLRCRLLLNP